VTSNFTTEPLDKIPACKGGAASGQQIVGNKNACSLRDGVFVHFEGVEAVLEFIADLLCSRGKLLGFAHRNEPCTKVISESRSEDEAAGLDTDHDIGTGRRNHFGEPIDNSAKSSLVLQQRCDVVKQDARLREVRNFANQLLKIVHAYPLISKDV